MKYIYDIQFWWLCWQFCYLVGKNPSEDSASMSQLIQNLKPWHSFSLIPGHVTSTLRSVMLSTSPHCPDSSWHWHISWSTWHHSSSMIFDDYQEMDVSFNGKSWLTLSGNHISAAFSSYNSYHFELLTGACNTRTPGFIALWRDFFITDLCKTQGPTKQIIRQQAKSSP